MARKPSQFQNNDPWRIRRRWMSAALIWMAGNAQFIIIWGQDNALHQNALVALLTGIVAIIGSYVFGAVWDDRNKNNTPPTETGE